MGKIYDSFLFFNELDILHMRLELLYDKVDYFIISECDTTFRGDIKPFYYEENKHLFEKYKNKIIHVKNTNSFNIDDIPDDIRNSPVVDYGASHWCREWLQREYVKKGMSECVDDDVIIFSDLDEIPDPNFIREYSSPTCLKVRNMIYYLNRENASEPWYGPQIAPYSYFKYRTLNSIRSDRNKFNIIDNGGWHLSYMGGPSRIKTKIKSYGHQEFNNSYILGSVDENVKNGTDVLNRQIKIVEFDVNQYPKKIVDLIEEYKYLVK